MKREKLTHSATPEEAMKIFGENNDLGVLADFLHIKHGSMCDQLNPRNPSKLHYLDAIEVSNKTGDHVLLKAWAQEAGYGIFELPKVKAGEEEMLDLILMLQKSSGTFAESFYKAREDGIIESHEASELLSLIFDKISLLSKLGEEIKAQVRTKA